MASLSDIYAVQGYRREGSQVLAAVTRSPGEMVVEDVSGPGPVRAGHVIVRPERVGICGSDFHVFAGEVGALSGARDFYPRVQGDEVSAIVDDPGDSERKELDIIGSSCATAADFGQAIRLVAACRTALAQVFSHHSRWPARPRRSNSR
jgi:threonine dehydrogenase-like Zn-dependent dehydrogenase